MALPDEKFVYPLAVQVTRNVVARKDLRELDDEKIRGTEFKPGDEIKG